MAGGALANSEQSRPAAGVHAGTIRSPHRRDRRAPIDLMVYARQVTNGEMEKRWGVEKDTGAGPAARITTTGSITTRRNGSSG